MSKVGGGAGVAVPRMHGHYEGHSSRGKLALHAPVDVAAVGDRSRSSSSSGSSGQLYRSSGFEGSSSSGVVVVVAVVAVVVVVVVVKVVVVGVAVVHRYLIVVGSFRK